jgi:hypothetical protein
MSRSLSSGVRSRDPVAHAGLAPNRPPVVASALTTADWYAPGWRVDSLPAGLGGDAMEGGSNAEVLSEAD